MDFNYCEHALDVPPGGYMGIDPSLRSTGVCVLSRHNARTWRLRPNITGVPRLLWLERKVSGLLEQEDPRIVVLEGYAHGRSKQAHQIGEWGGVLRLLLFRRGASFYEAAPGTLKKFVTGKGNVEGKAPILLHLYKRWGLDVEQQDEGDASALALLAAYLNDPLNKMPPLDKPRREALSKVNVISAERRRTRPPATGCRPD